MSEMRQKHKIEKRHATKRLVARVTPVEEKEVKEAIGTSNEAWMGVSHFVRMAVLNWARGVNSQKRAAAIRKDVLKRPSRVTA